MKKPIKTVIGVQQLQQALEEGEVTSRLRRGEQKLEDLIRTLHARELILLRQTLEYAELNVPYYRRLFRQIGFRPERFERLRDLRNLPVLTKKAMSDRLDDFISERSTIKRIACTSGTSGQRLPRFISEEEVQACALLNELVFARPFEVNGTGKKKDIMLRVVPSMKRYQGAIGNNDLPQVNVSLNWHYPKYSARSNFDDFVVKQLFERFPIPGTAKYVTVVHVTPPFLIRVITDEMAARNLSPAETHVRCIVCTGGLVTNRIRKLVEKQWRAKLVTSYSMTELNGYAMECRLFPSRYHFNPAVYAEVVHPRTNEPVADGREGILLVTSLYPFQQAQPFIRYNTGDLVTYIGRHCECGSVAPTIEYLGRFEHCIDLSDVIPEHVSKQYLAATHAHDVLEDLPEVPSMLYPRFEVKRINREGGAAVLQLTVELHHLGTAPSRKDVKRRILKGLQTHYSDWNELVEQGKLAWEITLRSRGEMPFFFRLYPES